jgi:hypothetical protein
MSVRRSLRVISWGFSKYRGAGKSRIFATILFESLTKSAERTREEDPQVEAIPSQPEETDIHGGHGGYGSN